MKEMLQDALKAQSSLLPWRKALEHFCITACNMTVHVILSYVPTVMGVGLVDGRFGGCRPGCHAICLGWHFLLTFGSTSHDIWFINQYKECSINQCTSCAQVLCEHPPTSSIPSPAAWNGMKGEGAEDFKRIVSHWRYKVLVVQRLEACLLQPSIA